MARSRKRRLIHLDTHVVCWLYAGRVDLLSAAARDALETGVIAVSPMVGLELQYLREIGRIRHGPRRILAALQREIGLTMSELPFLALATRAQSCSWTRDPFDRLIAAEAGAARARLVTRDDHLRRNFRPALW
ncbi:MAG: PIN domain-containing protein [Pseudomonadota bacterium]